MNDKKTTFSRQVKDEMSRVPCGNVCCRQAELAAAFFGAGLFNKGQFEFGQAEAETIVLATAHSAGAARISALCLERYGEAPLWQAGRELVSLTIESAPVIRAVRKDLMAIFNYDPGQNGKFRLNCPRACCRQAVLRAWHLTCGSISEPASGYHLELSMRRAEAAYAAVELLAGHDIRAGIVSRHGYDVVYIKEGQFIADFLLLTGAHLALLDFESLRVEKEMRNSVNRMVNCDSANTQRMADTAARQIELILRLKAAGGLALLPEDLQATAEIRLENPYYSIRELGELMQPPLGKSGMNHRLKRLERIAAELTGDQEDTCHGN